jgi:tetratricopeptide (TPR) repeat protein
MGNLDWRTVELDPGVWREPTPDETRIILWLPGNVENGYRHWERISNVPEAKIAVAQGLCTLEASSMPARQKLRGPLGRVLDWFRKHAGPHAWLLPHGGYAEQAGERQSGLLLAWAEEETSPVDVADLRARWPEGQQVRKVGKNLFVVSAAQPGAAAGGPVPLGGNPREQAEQLLGAARQSGDRRAEVSAQTDLGAALASLGESERGVVALEEALTMARQLGDVSLESDVLGNLGMAMLAAGQAGRALEPLGQVLAYARETGDRFQEKITLANLGAVHASLRDFLQALGAADQALALARELGDRQHEAELLWFEAIQQAELGQTDMAAHLAQVAIDIYATLRSPHISWLTDHLKKYRDSGGSLPAGVRGGAPAGGYYTGPTAVTVAPPAVEGPASDPGLLRMGFSAVKSMARFAASGLKTVPAATHQQRLETCAACPHHTGVRCKLCGCFTSVKAWLPHENCPIEKWAR